MAIVNTGDDLVTPILQSGWTVVSDGFGLHTSVSVYKADHTSALTAFLVKGTAHPDPSYTYLKIDKWRISWDALDMATVTVDYVGIDPSENGGLFTNPNTSGANEFLCVRRSLRWCDCRLCSLHAVTYWTNRQK